MGNGNGMPDGFIDEMMAQAAAEAEQKEKNNQDEEEEESGGTSDPAGSGGSHGYDGGSYELIDGALVENKNEKNTVLGIWGEKGLSSLPGMKWDLGKNTDLLRPDGWDILGKVPVWDEGLAEKFKMIDYESKAGSLSINQKSKAAKQMIAAQSSGTPIPVLGTHELMGLQSMNISMDSPEILAVITLPTSKKNNNVTSFRGCETGGCTYARQCACLWG